MVARRSFAAVLAAAGAVLTLLLAGAGVAAAAQDGRAPTPWATVNVCDTAAQPDAIGVRGSMAGTGDRRDTLSMRFELQFLRRSDGRWQRVGRAGDSGMTEVGDGAGRTRQAGRTFTVTPPAEGKPAHVLRALVTFEWRRGAVLLRRARRVTRTGHPDAVGADPRTFTASTCTIR